MNIMSALLQIIDLSFSRSQNTLFENLHLSINPGDRIGLVGHNGCGKSSLLQLIRGDEEADSGEIRTPRGLKIGWVEQFLAPSLGEKGLLEAVLEVLDQQDIASLSWMAESQLLTLGFKTQQFHIPVKDLSGGQQNLLLLARALLLKPDLLLMDEPGNHMDILAMGHLQNYLTSQCPCPYLIISHDRHLLEKVCNKTVFIRDQRSYSFDLPFEAAALRLEEQDETAEKHRQLEENEIKRLQATAKRLAIWGREHDNENLSRKAKTIEKRAAKLDGEKTNISSGSGLSLRLDTLQLAAKQILTLEQAKIFTPNHERQLLEVEHLVIRPGERVALLGINGVGKSSTLECIRQSFAGSENNSGEIRFNPRATLGYYDQGLESLNVSQTRTDWLRDQIDSDITCDNDTIKKTLINAGVDYQDFSRQVNTLSGGERARMMFMALQLNQPNLMILDEPTNHIDLFGKQQLSEQLKASGATLLITSHDRYFLEHIATRWLWINNGSLQEINSSDAFYQALLDNTQAVESSVQLGENEHTTIDTTAGENSTENSNEENALQRIDWLEAKLRDDKARKTKNQKPVLQEQWQQELDKLWSQLE